MRAPAELVWAAVREPYEVHLRLAPGFVAAVAKDGESRVVTFADGFVVRERIVTIDDVAMRFVYSAHGGRATHHMASMHVLTDGDGSRLVWTTDFLPAELRPVIAANIERGLKVMIDTLEAAARVRQTSN